MPNTTTLTKIESELPPMSENQIQILGDPTSTKKPVKRLLTLEDIEDDCPICQQNRALIEAGTPPMALVFE